MKANPSVRIEIAGHTDDRGDPAANLLSRRNGRRQVVAYLTQAGIARGRMQSIGYGKTRPAIPNTSDENRQRNRRIEWRVL
jgi:outer membrane protein OmpA-like peptidoglycan-associated protein